MKKLMNTFIAVLFLAAFSVPAMAEDRVNNDTAFCQNERVEGKQIDAKDEEVKEAEASSAKSN